MRTFLLLTGVLVVSGCSHFFPSRSQHSCEAASHALRVHDSRIEAARAGSMGFTANLATRGYQTYHCVLTRGDQVACSTVPGGAGNAPSAQVNRLMRERSVIESRVARACQI
ncbi:MAG: hypothetical protein ACK4NW_02830 [Roseinatronobacter sp.]